MTGIEHVFHGPAGGVCIFELNSPDLVNEGKHLRQWLAYKGIDPALLTEVTGYWQNMESPAYILPTMYFGVIAELLVAHAQECVLFIDRVPGLRVADEPPAYTARLFTFATREFDEPVPFVEVGAGKAQTASGYTLIDGKYYVADL